ncbi:hypothetical protein BRD16_03350 [Halobacteriales archaeon SW_6_65_46]|nr:MAG: hypothetical protein BRD16_03350 [Halobacteriales archaeon SW_6_65_46]
MKEYLNVRYLGIRPVHILIYIFAGCVGTTIIAPLVLGGPYGLDKLAIGVVEGILFGFFVEIFVAD